jgi:hypothetical protein
VNYGDAYLAAYNAKNGKRIFLEKLAGRKTYIDDAALLGDVVLLVKDDSVIKCDTRTGKILGTYLPDFPVAGFVGADKYVLAPPYFKRVVDLHSDKFPIHTKTGAINILNEELKPVTVYGPKDVFTLYHTYGTYKFIGNKSTTVIIDAQNKEVARLPVSRNSKVYKDKLYAYFENSILQVDLSSILSAN